jgi:hypothetical protein
VKTAWRRRESSHRRRGLREPSCWTSAVGRRHAVRRHRLLDDAQVRWRRARKPGRSCRHPLAVHFGPGSREAAEDLARLGAVDAGLRAGPTSATASIVPPMQLVAGPESARPLRADVHDPVSRPWRRRPDAVERAARRRPVSVPSVAPISPRCRRVEIGAAAGRGRQRTGGRRPGRWCWSRRCRAWLPAPTDAGPSGTASTSGASGHRPPPDGGGDRRWRRRHARAGVEQGPLNGLAAVVATTAIRACAG